MNFFLSELLALKLIINKFIINIQIIIRLFLYYIRRSLILYTNLFTIILLVLMLLFINDLYKRKLQFYFKIIY